MIRKSSFRMFSDQIEYVVIVWRQEIGLRSKKCKEDDDDEQTIVGFYSQSHNPALSMIKVKYSK